MERAQATARRIVQIAWRHRQVLRVKAMAAK